uniref:Uncharacterized protein n=1 Tax=Oryza sativa subsp. japonica TaxID=39947 RepID=Q5VS85_ORYSJ|nr:hypothetical protein [Oryza sativa Japonica Group]
MSPSAAIPPSGGDECRPPPPTTALASRPVPRRAVPHRRQPLPQSRRRAAASSGQTSSWASPCFASPRAPAAVAIGCRTSFPASPRRPPPHLSPPCPNEMKSEREEEVRKQ